jgi:hypothetical protein
LSTFGGTVEQLGAAVADFVVEGNGVVFGDFHEREVFSGSVFSVWSVPKGKSKRLNGLAENCKLNTENFEPLLPKRLERVICALAFGFENDLQEASEVAIGPAFLLEPAKIFRGEFVERTTFETAEGHGPGAELFPVGGGLGEVHKRSMGRGWGI